MRKKSIISKNDLKPYLKEGVQKIASIVKTTLGPGGLPIIIERVGQQLNGDPLAPKMTKDGVSVADECFDSDPRVDLAIQTVKSICRKTNMGAGDGPNPLYTPILTPTGWKTMGDMKVGMDICGTNGTIQQVLGVFPKGKKEIYEVEFSDKRVVECCGEHLWSVTDYKDNKRVVTTQEMLDESFVIETNGRKRYKFYTPRTLVNFQEIKPEMPLDPYLVGVLLGDGSLTGTGSIELSLGLNKKHIIDKLKLPEGFSLTIQEVKREGRENHYRVKIKGLDSEGRTIHRLVESIGLLGVSSETKFIPKSYLYASIETREALLQGLLDTDGHINTRNLFEFSTVSKTLANDITELVYSLGKAVYTCKREKTEKDGSFSLKPIYRIQELKGYSRGNKIVDIRPTGKFTEMQCIKVSNPDHLYIMDKYIVTHNTTSAIVLGEAIFLESLNYLEQNPKVNPQKLRTLLENSSQRVVDQLKKIAKPVKDPKTISEVATISANGDEEIGQIIGDAFEAVGSEGVVTVEEGGTLKNTLQIIEGYHFNRGAEGRDIFFNNTNKTAWQAKNVHVIIYDGDLKDPEQLFKPLTVAVESNNGEKPAILVLANSFSVPVITWASINKVEKGWDFCFVQGPHITHVRTGYYDDIAIMLGAYRFGNGNRNMESCTEDDIGLCDRAKVTKYTTTLYEGQGTEEAILERVEHLKARKVEAESAYDEQIIADRLGSLTQGIAKIGVGGATELEIKEKYDRIEDALNAARSAIEEGIVLGGGSTLFRISLELEKSKDIGDQILAKCLKAPINQILDNRGLEKEKQSILNTLSGKKFFFQGKINPNLVYDAKMLCFKSGFDCGIIDPVKATRLGLENAISISSLLMTTGGGIYFDRN